MRHRNPRQPPAVLRSTLRLLALALLAVASSGCVRAAFAVANVGAAPPESSVVFDAAHGLALDVYRPQGALGPAPTVVFFYGGGWDSGSRAQYRFVGRRLAAHGVLAVLADYRRYPRTTFPGFVEDGATAVAWARRHAREHGGDPARLYVAGHSAGAQIAALLATDARYLRAQGLSPRDLAGAIGLSGPYDFAITGRYRAVFGPPAQWPQAQAVNFVDGDEPRFLLVHGEADRVVEARDSVELAALLRERAQGAELVLLPGKGHTATVAGLYRPALAPQVLPAVLAFVQATAATSPAPTPR